MNHTGEKEVVLLIADISGYTRFMVANEKSKYHAQVIISELMRSIIHQIEMPLEVAKLEGDAIFLYARKDHHQFDWDETRKLIGGKMISFFEGFSRKMNQLVSENICTDCEACKNIRYLKLKIVVHSGTALLYQLGKFEELSGVDVILVHRLLKNSIPGNEYVLMTERAYNDIHFPHAIDTQEGKEEYDHLGSVKTYVYMPNPVPYSHAHAANKSTSSKVRDFLRKVIKPALMRRGWVKLPAFKHLEEEQREAVV